MDELFSKVIEEKYYIEKEIERLLLNWNDTTKKIDNFIRSFPSGDEKKRRAGEIFQRLDEIRNRLFFYYGPGLELSKKLQQNRIEEASRYLVNFLNSVQHYMDQLSKIK